MEDKKESAIKAGQDAKLILENPQMVAAFNSVLNNGYLLILKMLRVGKHFTINKEPS